MKYDNILLLKLMTKLVIVLIFSFVYGMFLFLGFVWNDEAYMGIVGLLAPMFFFSTWIIPLVVMRNKKKLTFGWLTLLILVHLAVAPVLIYLVSYFFFTPPNNGFIRGTFWTICKERNASFDCQYPPKPICR